MNRYYIFKDGNMEGSAATKEAALQLIRSYQEQEKQTHQWLHANFSMIYGEEVFVPYQK